MAAGIIEFKAGSTVQGVSLTATGTGWIDVVMPGGVDAVDNSGNNVVNLYGIARLGTDDTDELRIFRRPAVGCEFVAARHKYDEQLSVDTQPVVQLFGRAGTDGEWELLKNVDDSITCAFTSGGSDARSKDGLYSYSTVDHADNVWDCSGCNEFVFVVKTAVAGTGGNIALSSIQAKFL
jgi:hypothetical protein